MTVNRKLKFLVLLIFAVAITFGIFSCAKIIDDMGGGYNLDFPRDVDSSRFIRKTELIKNGSDVSEWVGDSRYYQVNDPIHAELVGGEIRVTSLCVDTIKNVDVIQEGVVIYNIGTIEFLDEVFITPKSAGQVSLKVRDANYKKFSALPPYWHFTMLKKQGDNATMNKVVIEGLVKSLTNTLYVLTSDLFWECMNHYEDITGGRELWKYARKADYSGMGVDRKYGDRDEGVSMEWETREPDNYKYRIDAKYSEAERAKSKEQFMTDWRLNRDFDRSPWLGRFTKSGGSGVTSWPSFNAVYVNKYVPHLGNGISVRDNEFKNDSASDMKVPTDEATPIASDFFHEVCHLVGYWHFSSFTYGEFTESDIRFFPAVARLLSEMKELPYNFDGNTAKSRPGFDRVTKYIYEHPQFFQRRYWYHLHNNIDYSISRYNGFKSALDNAANLPPFMQAMIGPGDYYTSFEKRLASENSVSMDTLIYKPEKVTAMPTKFLDK